MGININIDSIINRCVCLNLSKSTQTAAGLNALKPAANGRYFMCKPLPYYLHLLYRRTFILLSVKCIQKSLQKSSFHPQHNTSSELSMTFENIFTYALRFRQAAMIE